MVRIHAARWCLPAWLAMAAACGPAADPNAAPAGAAGATGPDLRRGEVLSFACQACHSLKAGEAHHIGPNLHGIFGKRVASAADFAYSDALRAADFVWTVERLDQWLAAPETFLPGNNMPFAGYANAADRRDLMAFLRAATAAE